MLEMIQIITKNLIDGIQLKPPDGGCNLETLHTNSTVLALSNHYSHFDDCYDDPSSAVHVAES